MVRHLLGLIFLVFLLAGAVNLATGGGELFRKLTAFLVATVPVLVLLGLVRAVALLRRGTGASWLDALGAFLIWQSTSLVVARASVLGLFAKRLRSWPRRRRASGRSGGKHCGRTGPSRSWPCSAQRAARQSCASGGPRSGSGPRTAQRWCARPPRAESSRSSASWPRRSG